MVGGGRPADPAPIGTVTPGMSDVVVVVVDGGAVVVGTEVPDDPPVGEPPGPPVAAPGAPPVPEVPDGAPPAPPCGG